jgi:competence protein ComEC
MNPPRRRTARRVAATPPGSSGRDPLVDVELLPTSQLYVDSTMPQVHRVGSSTRWLLLAGVLWIGIWVGEWWPSLSTGRFLATALLIAVCILFRFTKVTLSVVIVVLFSVGLASGSSAWHQPLRILEGPCEGVATIRVDPSFRSYGTATVLEVQDKRYKVLAYGASGRALAQRLVGESVRIEGECSRNDGPFSRFDRINHVVGRVTVTSVSETYSEGSLFVRTANRMRRSLVRGVEQMPSEHRALFTGLVIGDDRDQSAAMVQRFRDSGLSHLCAVSGQNVAYLLIIASPLLRRRSQWLKWTLTMLLLVWFVALTRGEPSVLRAAFMAGMVASNAALKSPANARIVLSRAVIVLLLIDPMLAWSVGFALSVGATAGLAWASAGIGRMMGSRGILAATLAAQLGTAPISLLVFGFVPVVSLLANPLAIPVAGVVMTIGIPVALLASAVPVLVPLVSWLLTIPVAWVDGVSRFSSILSPHGWWNRGLWIFVAILLMYRAKKNAKRHTAVAG